IVEIKAQLRTIRANRDNFDLSVSRPPFDGVADALRQQLIDWAGTSELHANQYIDSAEGTLRKSEMHITSIEARTEAQQADEWKRLNRWMICLGVAGLVFAVVQTVGGLSQIPNDVPEWKWWHIFRGMAGLAVVLALSGWWFVRRADSKPQ